MVPSGKLRIGVLSSSRADFGIYLPLLNEMRRKGDISFEIIAFGTHLSNLHGNTLSEIQRSGFEVKYEINSLLASDSPNAIATAYALTCMKFSDFWAVNAGKFDWVLCLGDRFEMAAAVMAGIPQRVKFAHIHAGEITIGAIDNIYRDCISLASQIHFVSTKEYGDRIKSLMGDGFQTKSIITGALSLDSVVKISLLSKPEFKAKWGIDLDKPTILVTIHPETVDFENNSVYANEAVRALELLVEEYQIVITMPNADTNGSLFRGCFAAFKARHSDRVWTIENFGTQSYFTCMHYADHMIGNTSSGIIESASFGIYVINLGNRQKGRTSNPNVINVPFDAEKIIAASDSIAGKRYSGTNIYMQKDSAEKIISTLLNHNA
jgi:GDP/UDP-N,N'-diacetylbacillosamine 2-epimerase (hydrolysing)